MSVDYDVAVIGSGFAGSLAAMIARRQRRSVILIERARHPRFVIGESSTPLSNLLLEDLALRYSLPGIAPLAKWGTWQKAFPNLDCGLKRGFTFYHHQFGQRAATGPDREDQLLVSASPHDAIADTHWNRADVDAHFVREAQHIGVEYIDETELTEAVELNDSVKLIGRRHGHEIQIAARFVIDATGPRGFLYRVFALPELSLPDFPQTRALYAHFRGVRRMDDLLDQHGDNPPYPIDEAAVHHVFDGGWVWVLRFRSGVTSAGVSMGNPLAERLQLDEGRPAWERLLEHLPTVRDQFADSTLNRRFTYARQVAFRCGVITGRRWALLPSAAGFADPLLSTGFPLALLGVTRLAAIMEQHWGTERFTDELAGYGRQTDDDLLAAARLIGNLYASMDNFPLFVSLSMIYFAAASFAETARRLGKPHLASAFLLHDRPAFDSQLRAIFERVRAVTGRDDILALNSEVLRVIDPINVAGLGNPERRNWYPVDGNDLLRGASKVQASREEIGRLLDRCGFRDVG